MWHLGTSKETLDMRHDEACLDTIPGIETLTGQQWSKHMVKVNDKRKRGTASAPGKKGDGKPNQSSWANHSAALSPNRQFDELAGVGPLLRRAHHAELRDEGKRAGGMHCPNSVRALYKGKDATPEEHRAYKAAYRQWWTRTYEKPYVHPYKAELSPLVWSAQHGRSHANNFFVAPLRAGYVSPQAPGEREAQADRDGAAEAGAGDNEAENEFAPEGGESNVMPAERMRA